MSVLDNEVVQRGVRIPLALVCLLVTLGAVALVPISFGFSLPPALITGALTAWLFGPPDEEPTPLVNALLGVGLVLFGLEVLLLLVLALIGPSD